MLVGDAIAFLDPMYSAGTLLALASAEMAATCAADALESGDLSGAKLEAFVPDYLGGLTVVHRLIHAFYDPAFSFRRFVDDFPEHRAALVDCFVGDVFDRDTTGLMAALDQMTPRPAALR